MKFYIFYVKSGRGFNKKKLVPYTDDYFTEEYGYTDDDIKYDAEAWMDDVARQCEHVTWGFYEVPESSVEKKWFTESCCKDWEKWKDNIPFVKILEDHNYCPWCGKKKWKYVVFDKFNAEKSE